MPGQYGVHARPGHCAAGPRTLVVLEQIRRPAPAAGNDTEERLAEGQTPGRASSARQRRLGRVPAPAGCVCQKPATSPLHSSRASAQAQFASPARKRSGRQGRRLAAQQPRPRCPGRRRPSEPNNARSWHPGRAWAKQASVVENSSLAGLAHHADKAGQVEVPVLPGQADAGGRDGQVIPPHSRGVDPAAHLVGDRIDIAALGIRTQYSLGMCQDFGRRTSTRSRWASRRVVRR